MMQNSQLNIQVDLKIQIKNPSKKGTVASYRGEREGGGGLFRYMEGRCHGRLPLHTHTPIETRGHGRLSVVVTFLFFPASFFFCFLTKVFCC